MSYTATYTESPSTYPWMQVFLALGAAGSGTGVYLDGASDTSSATTFSYTVLNAHDALVATIFYQCAADSGETGHFDISDDGGNTWTLAGEVYYTDVDGSLWGLQVWVCTVLAAGFLTINTTAPGDLIVHMSNVSEFGAGGAAMSFITSTTGQDVTGVPTLTMDATDPVLLFSIAAVLSGGAISTFTHHTPFVANAFSAASGGLTWWVIGEYESFEVTGPPPPAPPLRYKKIPLTHDFASTTYDQANRLAMYELYRSCGLDPTNPFLQSLFDGLADSLWKPPVTLTITVFSEAVDDDWNILKQVQRGQRITLDASVSEEWAGDYEFMSATYNPFQPSGSFGGGGDPSMPTGSTAIAPGVDRASGTITLVLRTYDERVFFDVSQTPSYANVPLPIAEFL
jgi:hypothetical protein